MREIFINLPKPKKSFYLTSKLKKIVPTNFVFQNGEKFDIIQEFEESEETVREYSNGFTHPTFIDSNEIIQPRFFGNESSQLNEHGERIRGDDIIIKSAKTGKIYKYFSNCYFNSKNLVIELVVDDSFYFICNSCGNPMKIIGTSYYYINDYKIISTVLVDNQNNKLIEQLFPRLFSFVCKYTKKDVYEFSEDVPITLNPRHNRRELCYFNPIEQKPALGLSVVDKFNLKKSLRDDLFYDKERHTFEIDNEDYNKICTRIRNNILNGKQITKKITYDLYQIDLIKNAGSAKTDYICHLINKYVNFNDLTHFNTIMFNIYVDMLLTDVIYCHHNDISEENIYELELPLDRANPKFCRNRHDMYLRIECCDCDYKMYVNTEWYWYDNYLVR